MESSDEAAKRPSSSREGGHGEKRRRSFDGEHSRDGGGVPKKKSRPSQSDSKSPPQGEGSDKRKKKKKKKDKDKDKDEDKRPQKENREANPPLKLVNSVLSFSCSIPLLAGSFFFAENTSASVCDPHFHSTDERACHSHH